MLTVSVILPGLPNRWDCISYIYPLITYMMAIPVVHTPKPIRYPHCRIMITYKAERRDIIARIVARCGHHTHLMAVFREKRQEFSRSDTTPCHTGWPAACCRRPGRHTYRCKRPCSGHRGHTGFAAMDTGIYNYSNEGGRVMVRFRKGHTSYRRPLRCEGHAHKVCRTILSRRTSGL